MSSRNTRDDTHQAVGIAPNPNHGNNNMFSSHKQLLFVAVALAAVAAPARADQLISGFEGDLSSAFGADWNVNFNNIFGTSFITDDPLDNDTEGVSEGTQALQVDHGLWDAVGQPWMELDSGVAGAQAFVDNDFFELDMTPIVDLTGPGFTWRQAFLSASGNTLGFTVFKIDYAAPGFDESGQPQTGTLSWDLNEMVTNTGDAGEIGATKTWKQWAQDSVDAGAEGFWTMRLIFQGGNNDLFEFPFSTAIDAIRLVGATAAVEGDFNGDGLVDNGDLNLLLGSWGSDTVPPEWVNGFETPVDNGELNSLLGNWGFGTGTAVPEPGSMTLVGVLAAALGARRRRR